MTGVKSPLDHVVWSSLRGEHQHLAIVDPSGRAAKYHHDVCLFGAIETPDAEGWAAASDITPPGGIFVVFQADVEPPPVEFWEVLFEEPVDQLVAGSLRDEPPLPDDVAIQRLGEEHVEAMVDLTTRTQPGPFTPGTIALGNYYGIFDHGRLLAMAGQRFRPDGFVEISAVCTDPDARQRGYAAALTRCNVDQIRAEGRQALLHTRFDNEAARRLYEAMGFVFRRQIAVVVARKIGEPSTS